MSYFQSILLGIIQGLGEFLPISSSAHLVVLPWLIQFEDPGLAFDVALHLGTLIAVLAYFWKDWWTLSKASLCYTVLKQRDDETKRWFYLMLYLIAATIPAVVAGLLLKDLAETVFRHPLVITATMLGFGALLLYIDKKSRQQKDLQNMDLKNAVLIGLAQCFALIPGTSRSGATITAALALGFNRFEAARFSFLMSTPIIFGACLLHAKYFVNLYNDPIAIAGIVSAALVGFLAIKYLMKMVQRFSYAAFCYYRFAFGILVAVLYFARAA
ncbi:MAG: undecaprenyl-diphosphatase UppP [Deltaproteobacteria bacterium]|nr:undecaprenyl-diphosphatase UppP [Deltaproteobacteria bacterium]